MPGSDEQVLRSLHPRQVCWLVAVSRGVKPTAWIEAVGLDIWADFLVLARRLDLCVGYEAAGGETTIVTGDSGREADRRCPLPSGKIVLELGEESLAQPVRQPGFSTQVYVARNVRDLVRAIKARKASDPKEMGRCFGYPRCCTKSYIEAGGGAEARHRYNQALFETHSDQDMEPEMWALFHVPCSPGCEASHQLAESYLDAVKSYSEGIFQDVVYRLSLPRLSYSTAERFIDLEQVDTEISGTDRDGVVERAETLIGVPEETLTAIIRRPLQYADWERPPHRVRLLPGTLGLRWVSYATGRGVLVTDSSGQDFDVRVTIDALPEDQRPYAATAFHLYRCRKL